MVPLLEFESSINAAQKSARELGVILKELGVGAQRWKSPKIPAPTVE